MKPKLSLFSEDALIDPHPVFARLLRESPVCQVEHGIWAVSRHRDVAFILKHPELFSSAGRQELRAELMDERLRDDAVFAEEASIIASDPPAHTRLRKLINPAFAPKAMARLEERIGALANAYLDSVVDRPEIDLIADFAAPFPVTVIAEMLGIDPARRADFKRWTDDAVNTQPFHVYAEEDIERILASRAELRSFFTDMIAERRARPREDLISDLSCAEAEPPLDAKELLAMTILLLIAGNVTTTNLLGNGTLALLEHPDALARLRREPDLVPTFIEEALRFDGPVKMILRRAVGEIALGGVTLPRGAAVMAIVAAANRDPEVFPDPDRFDVARDGHSHLAFGFGIHFCVGAPLARLEGRVAFEAMLRRLPNLTRAPGPVLWTPSFGLRGLRSLRLRLETPAAAA